MATEVGLVLYEFRVIKSIEEVGFMQKDRVQCFYVDRASGEEALRKKIETLKAEGFEILPCQSTDELACDHVEIESGWIIITALRPEIPLGTPDPETLPKRNRK